MTYLSLLTLNPRSRAVQRDLADCQQMHRTILRAFPDSGAPARAEYGVLYRLEGAASPESDDGASGRAFRLLVQSASAPDWETLPGGYVLRPAACKPVDTVYDSLAPGRRLTFRLRANPTKRVFRQEPAAGEEKDWSGKRVNLTRPDEQIDWLRRKGRQGGFELLDVRLPGTDAVPAVDMRPEGTLRGTRRETGRLTFGSVLFDGRLEITDADLFRQTLQQGIGSGKAYGFGLLSIAPA